MKASVNPALQRFYSGLSGLELPVPKYLFPPEHQDSSRLTYYATFFNSIEVNSTFYKLPMGKTLAKWKEQVPPGFAFTFKLWKEITHDKDLDFKEQDVKSFFEVIAYAGEKKGCVLVQFPPSLGKVRLMQLGALLACIDQYNTGRAWKIAVEFRNKSWYQPEVYDLLESHGAAMVIQDIPKSVTPMIDHASNFLYIRFHGPSGNYRDSYSEHFLAEYATYVREWLQEGKTVFVYFNNTMGDAFKNLETLNNFIYSTEY
jgi:uncharacterized protein YecE (DUF72 family)